MTGCRHGAKNTLPKNYLWLAEHAGAEVVPLTTVTALRERPQGGWYVDAERTGSWRPRATARTLTATHVVVAAGAYGTQRLLHRMRDDGTLPRLSGRLGVLTRTNSESLLGAQSRRRDVDFTRGVAITSSFHPSGDTHIEPVRYGRGSNAMGLLSTVLTDGGAWPADRALGRRVRAPSRQVRPIAVGAPLVAAHGDRPGHAGAGQLVDRLGQARTVRTMATDDAAGARAAGAVVDPGGQRRGAAAGAHRRR